MGLYREGPPREFIKKIKDEFNFDCFIETGTYRATTAIWASTLFKKVYTIEAYKPLYDEVISVRKNYPNVSFIFGNSKEKLEEVLFEVKEPVIIWLDAHYSGEGTFGENEKCPLIKEIELINNFDYDSIILIDDARVFLSPYSMRFGLEEWPDITTILDILNEVRGRYIIILEDVIFCVPERMKHLTAKYSQELNSLNSFIDTDGLGIIKKLLKYFIRKIKGL